jgi:hypothetical protein
MESKLDKSEGRLYSLKWVVRGHNNHREFRQNLIDIHDAFKYTCSQVGTDEYWQTFMSNPNITRILKLTNLSDNVWSGFVAIRDGYRCFPIPDKPGYSECSYGHKSWYVELICADNSDGLQGRGSEMMQEVIRSAVEHGQQYVCLSALPYVIMWYYKQGFRLTMDASCVEPRDLQELASDIKRYLKIRGKPFVDDKEVFEDKDFVNFLRKAVAHGLGANRMKYKNQMSGCDDILTETCAEDGVYMMICLEDKTFEFQSDLSIVFPDKKEESELHWFVQTSKTGEIPEEEFSLKKLIDWKDVPTKE